MKKKLSEYKNEEALDLLADLIEPTSIVLSDKEITESLRTESKLKTIAKILKKYKAETLQVLALLDGVPVDEYECDVFTLPLAVLEILNDKSLQTFFKSQGLKMEGESFGSATENTEGQNE